MYKVSLGLVGFVLGSLSLIACEQKSTTIETSVPPPSSAPSKQMHPSWDADNNGVNDCETNGSCDHSIDYTQPRPAAVATPAFDCTKSSQGSIEYLICQEPALAQLDNTLTSVYTAATEKVTNEHSPTLVAEQRGWIKGRDDCWKAEDKFTCIKTTYERRIAELQARYQLVAANGPIRFQCGASAADEITVTFYQSTPPTLIAERGDQTSLMFLTQSASGGKYVGRNEHFWEHHGEARIMWSYDSAELACKKID